MNDKDSVPGDNAQVAKDDRLNIDRRAQIVGNIRGITIIGGAFAKPAIEDSAGG